MHPDLQYDFVGGRFLLEMALKARNNKKGFTLVEVIVVVVILAILAAIMVPSMIGWINKAEDKTAVVEGRTILVAGQTIVSENYKAFDSATVTMTPSTHSDNNNQIQSLADVGATVTSMTVTDGKVTAFEMKSSGNKTVTYSSTADDPYTVS